MSAKKGLSSTLRNLKFMQRAAVAQRLEEKADAEVDMEPAAAEVPAATGGSSIQVTRKWLEEKADVEVDMEPPAAAAEVLAANGVGVGSSVYVTRKCVVVMEGNPHPGAVRGRMSFQNFNPAIDKLNDEASGRPAQSASPSNSHQDSANNTTRTDDVSAASRFRDFNIDSSESISLNELKRKEPELDMETPPSRRQLKPVGPNADGQSSSQRNGFGSRKKSNNREKLDYNLLRQRKS